jgi:hypothetical protein
MKLAPLPKGDCGKLYQTQHKYGGISTTPPFLDIQNGVQYFQSSNRTTYIIVKGSENKTLLDMKTVSHRPTFA